MLKTSGHSDESVYSYLKSKGHSDDEIRDAWQQPNEVSMGEGFQAVGRGVESVAKQIPSMVGNMVMHPIESLMQIPHALYETGKGVADVAKTAFSPNMPASERLQHLEQGGQTLGNLGTMAAGGRLMSNAWQGLKQGFQSGLAEPPITPPGPPTLSNPRPIPGGPKTLAGPAQPVNAAPEPAITQAIDPNMGPMGPSGQLSPRPFGNPTRPLNAQEPLVTQITDPNVPMNELLPRSQTPLGKAGNQGPPRGVAEVAEGEASPVQMGNMAETGFFEAPANRVVAAPGQSLAMGTVDAMKQAVEIVGPEKFREMVQKNMAKRSDLGSVESQAAVVEETARSIVQNAEPLSPVQTDVLRTTAKGLAGSRTPKAKMAKAQWQKEGPGAGQGGLRIPPDVDATQSRIASERGKGLAGEGGYLHPWYIYKALQFILRQMDQPQNAGRLGAFNKAMGQFFNPSSFMFAQDQN